MTAVVEQAVPADYVALFTTSAGERVLADLAGKFGHHNGARIVTEDVHRQFVIVGQREMLDYMQAMIDRGLT